MADTKGDPNKQTYEKEIVASNPNTNCAFQWINQDFTVSRKTVVARLIIEAYTDHSENW